MNLKTVSLNSDREVDYWCGWFDCSRRDLRDAVLSVGTGPAAVSRYLRSSAFGEIRYSGKAFNEYLAGI